MVTRELSPAAIAMALLQLEEYGFQHLTGFHCKPLKYRVSLRGSCSSGGAVGAGTSTVSITTWVSLTTWVWTTGTSTVWMIVSAVGVAQDASSMPITISRDITIYKRFIFILLRIFMICRRQWLMIFSCYMS